MGTSHHWSYLLASCILVAGSAAVAAVAAPTLSSLVLRASDVPIGWATISPQDETITDPNDQGTDQSFISCARGHVLLNQFDQGPHALDSIIYGEGHNPFGTSILSVGSVAFGDGSSADAQTAESVLASNQFQNCWLKTSDELNQQQGITTPEHPSVLHQLPAPHLSTHTTAFAFDSIYSVLGTTVNFEIATSVVQRGPFVVMLMGFAFAPHFPVATLNGIITHIAGRLGGNAAPTPAHPSQCVSSQAPRPSVPILTDSQIGSDFHHIAKLASVSPGPPLVCSWHGTKLAHPTPYQKYDVEVDLSAQFFKSQAGAQTAATHNEAPFGPGQSISGLGAQVLLQPGQDEVAEALTIVTPDHDVISVALEQQNDTAHDHSVVKASLIAVAKQLIARMTPVIAVPSTITIIPATQQVRQGGYVTAVALVRDQQGNPLAGVQVTFQVGTGPDGPQQQTAKTDSQGRAALRFDSVVHGSESDTIVATVTRAAGGDLTSATAHVYNSTLPVVDAIGILTVKDPTGGMHSCTASVLASANQSVVLTAGHCVYGNGHYFEDFAFAPEFSGNVNSCPPQCKTPLGIWALSHPYADPRWRSSGDHTYDFGLLVANLNKQGQTIQQTVQGGLTLGVDEKPNQHWETYGYSGGYSLNNCQTSSASTTSAGSGQQFTFPCNMNGDDTAPDEGASGGPWLTSDHVVGADNSLSASCNVSLFCTKYIQGAIVGAAAYSAFQNEQTIEPDRASQ